MNQLNLFIELIRLKKPIGFMLLFWPCAWGLTLAYDFNGTFDKYIFYALWGTKSLKNQAEKLFWN